jgi:outer membrane protein assembly factor BamB
LRLSLAGRWRAHLAEGRPPGALTDHVRLQLGERGLTAHLEEEAVVPLLTALAAALAALTAGDEATVPLTRSRHTLRLSRRDGVARVSLETDAGRAIVRDEAFDVAALRRSVRSAAREVADALGAAAPPGLRLLQAPTPRRQRGVSVQREDGARPPLTFEFGDAPPAEVPADAGAAARVVVRLGAAPPLVVSPVEPLDLLEALAHGVETALKTRDWTTGRWEVPLDAGGASRLVFARDAAGLVLRIADRTGHERPGRVSVGLHGFATAVARFARQVEVEVPDRPRLRRIRRATRHLVRWAAALAAGAVRPPGSPRPALPPPMAPPATPADPLPVERLRHLAYRRRWRRHVPGLDARHITVVDEVIVVPGRDGLTALDGASGATLWTARDAVPLPDGPPDVLLAAGGRLDRVALADGAIRWRVRPFRGDRLVAQALRLEGQLVVSADDGAVAALDAETGRPRWRASTFFGAVAGLAAAGPVVWANGDDAFVHAWEAASGRVLFAVPLAGELQGAPRFDGAGLLVLAHVGAEAQGRLTCLDPHDGEHRWSRALDGTTSGAPVVTGSILLVTVHGASGARLQAVDTTSGAPLWDAPVGEDVRPHSPLAAGDLAFVKSTDGRVAALDLRTGAERWSAPADDPGEVLVRNAPPALCRGLLLVPGQTIRALAPGDGRVVSALACDELVPEWMHVWPGGDLAVAEGESITRYLLGGHLAVVE